MISDRLTIFGASRVAAILVFCSIAALASLLPRTALAADSDGDGIDNAVDNCPLVINASQADADSDGVGDACDNCTLVANTNQRDTNGDGYGNLCDIDLNNDEITNTLDLNIYKLAHRSLLGDANYLADADFDGDDRINTLDLNIFRAAYRLPPGPKAPPPPTAGFTFDTYGDSRADGTNCTGNGIHSQLVARMVNDNPAFVINNGDMIVGFANTTNFVQNGVCTAPGSIGSLVNLIAPLQGRVPPSGLPTAYFPVIGNHDDNWGSGWYPDPFGNGICDVFDMPALVPNHTQQPYYSNIKSAKYTDTDFDLRTCSTVQSYAEAVYPRFMYYSFDHANSHFLVLRINSNGYDLEACNGCGANKADYDDYYNIHQLDYVRADLAAARNNPQVQNIFVFLHAPLFGSGDNHSNNASRRVLSKEFSLRGVKAVFSGHSHVYERSVPVLVNDANIDGVQDNQAGTVYLTTGGGGSPLHGFNPQPWYSAARASSYHYLKVSVQGTTVTVQAIRQDGTVIETYAW
jgi:hypothetical protein